ncbi:WcaF family extracellular polysaccharide biosynthesis acetyltransferase (plasmid) [Limimaricola variabilis]|uniref:WcaF family extracellular polysaccharide biosynthesis acetyltransferase n=1 Tax=Limimaricola variabilis TaxID=1492771 RepID=UPI002AC9025A|nr:WcaF family extracellular polysaccharide biosynthesis acetyltransferase [Limimaricola variabilis]WPY96242.1 WcaF family extracellular polysaccharide biosynthesis acetyltransferase [Limimaricola variabilis]
MQLDRFSSAGFDRGAPRVVEALWLAANSLLLSSWLPGSGWRVRLLRIFGAQLGHGVVIKPGVRVKFPWRLRVGDHSWIGEDVWIDNLAEVCIGAHACLSQGAYLCTGSHDWGRESFDLITRPIAVADHAWVGARAVLAPGATLGTGAVLGMGSLGKGDMTSWTIHVGHPAGSRRARPAQQRSKE